MLNSDKADIRCQRSNGDREKRFFNQVSLDCDFPSLSWRSICPDLSIMNNSHMLCDVNIPNETYLCQNSSVDSDNKQEFIHLLTDDKSSIIKEDEIITHQKTKLKPPNFYKPKIKTLKIKTLVSNETLSNLPFDVHQHLISLLPDCDKVFSGETADEKCLSPSKTALNNEFFNRALMRFLWKLTNGKSVLSTESFINRIKNFPASLRPTGNSASVTDERTQKPKIIDIPQSNSSTIRLDYDINDAKVNYNFGVESPSFLTNRQFENQLNLKRENEVYSPSCCFDSSFLFNAGTYANSLNTLNNSEFESIQREFVDIFTNPSLQPALSPISDSIITPGSSKYKRRNSGDSLAPTPNKRPTRSTAGQLPARLKSSSPQPGTQGQIISTLLNGSYSPTSNKPVAGRKKNKEKRKYRSNEYNCPTEMKPASFYNDTILLNLRTKLSNRIHKNSLKEYQDHNPGTQSTLDFSSDINCFDSKSPRSLSPESDKLTYVNSPLSKNGQNHFRHLKYRNPYFENQTPTSPQWSFSSEFTSQSSVESVLSQKNIRIDSEDVTISDNLLDDMDSEEMPPPRRTLTVAAMREKMRAKKMAKEEKRKDFDKDFSFDIDKIENQKHMDVVGKHCQNSVMSTMMNMTRDNEDNDDDNIANDFDSFLIDDYQVEIDDKILNYSDDLDDLLLSGGNESLLEIIMKDPDAMDIANESFCSLNNDLGQNRSNMVSSDQTQCSFSNANIQSQGSIYDNRNSDILTTTHTTHHKPTVTVSSVCGIDNTILSQALTSVIQKVETDKTNSKDSNTVKSALQNAYLVDGNGLSDALKLIQSLNPGAKVTTQQFFLINSGPQLVLSQAPPTQASSHPAIVQSPVKSTPITSNLPTPTTTSVVTSMSTKCESSNRSNNALQAAASTLIFTNTKPSTTFNQAPILSSTLSVLPQFSAFNNKQSNIYSVNSTNFTNKIVNPINNMGCKLSTNNIQYQSTTTCSQQNAMYGTQKHVTSNQTQQNTIGIRLQLAPNFQNAQHLNIIQQSQNHVIPMMNQPLQFISPQHNNNISLITQTQPMSKLVLLYPNLNCSQLSTDSMKNESQQVILLSQKEQPTPISLSTGQTFQVLNGPNIWQQINPNLGTLLGSNTNNLVLMNPQTLNNQSFSFNYHQPLMMMSTPQVLKNTQINHKINQIITPPTASLSITVSKPSEEESIKAHSVSMNLNSNSSHNSCVEQLSNSSSSANSKLSFDDKSSCQLSKSHSDNLTDSDQEKSINSPQFQKSINSPQFQMLSNDHHNNQIINGIRNQRSSNKSLHLTVDIDSVSPPSNTFYHQKSISSQNDDRNTIHSPDTDYDQSDFEIPCLYSHKLESNNNEDNRHGEFDS